MSRSLITFLAATMGLWAQSNNLFVPVTPCRVADTRNATGTFGGPIMNAASTRSFPVPSGPCPIPSSATAYSFNVTVVPKTVLGYLTIWPAGITQPSVSTLNSFNGQVVANAAIVPAGTNGAVSVYVTDTTDVIIDIDGYFAPESVAAFYSTAYGLGALANNTGQANTGIGNNALSANTSGSYNSSLGVSALASNISGQYNAAVGTYALYTNTTGNYNSAFGAGAMQVSSGSQNTAVGFQALQSSSNGSQNAAVGYESLDQASGNFNIALGAYAGTGITVGSYNIDIGNQGVSNDSGVIRIGTAGSQTSTYIAGITGVATSGAAVIVSSSGQLGVQASSIKFKEDVRDLQEDDSALMQLRPVSFRYKGTTPLQFGLIAEEVEKVYPELVARDSDGQPVSVQYHELPALLLKKIQVQQKTINEQRDDINALKDRLSALEKLLQ